MLTNDPTYRPPAQLVCLDGPGEGTFDPRRWWFHPVEEEDNGGWQLWVCCQDAMCVDGL